MNIDLAQKRLKGNDLKFFKEAIALLKTFGFTIKFYKKYPIYAGNGVYIEGGLRPFKKTFICSLNGFEWFRTFVHEFCHFLQFIEDPKQFEIVTINCIKKNKYYSDNIMKIAALELDCEKRAVKLIKEYKLSLDVGKFIQSANSNVLQYYLMSKVGIPINDNLFFQMRFSLPKTFSKDYNKLLKKTAIQFINTVL